MDDDRLQELATLQATTGLSGADLLEFELWWSNAAEHERAFYTQTLDTITLITLSQLPKETPPAHLKAKVMGSLKERPIIEPRAQAIPPGYRFLMDPPHP